MDKISLFLMIIIWLSALLIWKGPEGLPENGLLADGKRNTEVIGIPPYPSLRSDKI